MVDAWLTLQHRGHTGEVVAVSRRGLLPSPHRKGNPLRLDRADIPLGTDLHYFVGWFRDLVRATERAGGNWRDVVDGVRPYNQLIWQSWPVSARRRFLEHTRAWWDIHRHRMAPEIHARVTRAVEDRPAEDSSPDECRACGFHRGAFPSRWSHASRRNRRRDASPGFTIAPASSRMFRPGRSPRSAR